MDSLERGSLVLAFTHMNLDAWGHWLPPKISITDSLLRICQTLLTALWLGIRSWILWLRWRWTEISLLSAWLLALNGSFTRLTSTGYFTLRFLRHHIYSSFFVNDSVFTVNTIHFNLIAKYSCISVLILLVSVNWSWIFVHFLQNFTFTEI